MSLPNKLEYATVNDEPSRQLLSRRQMAFVLDSLTWHLLGLLCFKSMGLIDFLWNSFSDTGYAILSLLLLLGWRLVFLMKDGFSGYSPGKWVFDLRVIDNMGKPIGPLLSMKRNLLLIIPLVGELVIWAQLRFGRRWFDQWCRCNVLSIDVD